MSHSMTSTSHHIPIGDFRSELATHEVEEAVSPKDDELPLTVFPVVIQKIILALNDCLRYPKDFTAAGILYAVSLAVGNTHKLKVKNGWNEGGVLYLCLVGQAGTNKSHPLSFALSPLHKRDEASTQQYIKEQNQYLSLTTMSKKERQNTGQDAPQRPILKKMLLSDYTPETVAMLHLNNRKGIGIYVDELAGWFKNFNRYNKGSEQEQWLSNWSGKPIITDRKSGQSIYINNPHISVAGTIQDAVLDEVVKESRGGNGFIDRILFVMPSNLQKEYWSDEELPLKYVTDYENIINRLLELEYGIMENDTFHSTLLELSPKAKELLFAWQKQNTDLSNGTDNEQIKGLCSKLEVYISRFALLLQMLDWACGEGNKERISSTTMEKAIILIEYFRMTAERVHTKLMDSSPLDKLPRNKVSLYEALPEQFKTEFGLQIAYKKGFKERSFKSFLMAKNLFERVGHGEYSKLL